jgi:methionyl-tRNA formyltransferase
MLVNRWVEANGHELVLVVTSPGPSRERNTSFREIISACPPSQNVLITTDLRELEKIIGSLSPDLLISASFPFLLPTRIIESVSLASVNLHASPLPRYRGPNPLRMIYDGCKTVGATLHYLDARFDTGPILCRHEVAVPEPLKVSTVREIWLKVLENVLGEGIDRAINSEAGVVQDHAQATYAASFSEEEYILDWKLSCDVLLNHWVALNLLAPASTAYISGAFCSITELSVLRTGPVSVSPGTILQLSNDQALIAVGDGAVQVRFVKIR